MRGCSVGALALIAAVALTASPAAAQYPYAPPYYAPGYYAPGYYAPPAYAPRSYARRAVAQKDVEHVNKDPFGDIPKGPLQIIVSIDEQKLRLYSDGTQVAETLVATGVPQLPTPTGVFSVIEKDRFHHSNIYSNAPMPFMQRITWSGVALHEGENIGHPASHGCIRMPHDFAAKLWVLTKLGVRVIVARPELKPVEIADAHLFVHKVAPPPTPPVPAAAAPAAPEPVKTAQTIDGNKATDASAVPNPAPPAAVTGNEPAIAPAPAAAAPAAPEPVKTAQTIDGDKTTDASAAPNPAPSAPPPVAAAPAVPEPVKTAQTIDGDKTTDASAAPNPAPPAAANGSDPAVAPAAAAPQAEPAKSLALPDTATALRPTLQADPPPAPAAQAVPVPPAKPAALLDAEAASHGPIAIFVSRKEKKIYVRQRFAPLFDAAITIDQPDRPLGTLIFTALDYLPDGATLRWNVVAMPAEPPKPPKPSRSANNDRQIVRYVRGRRVIEERVAAPVAAPTLPLAPQAPQDVLARIEIPQDVIERISELMVPGSSLVVSDQGLGDETGGGTDFIVVTR
ncbi:MAG TPA: L,D-transpeptidase [Xanthobacteraceae bacterium]|nr:L,D-transpeptidase [Xanthobacteraceae bacterium]